MIRLIRKIAAWMDSPSSIPFLIVLAWWCVVGPMLLMIAGSFE